MEQPKQYRPLIESEIELLIRNGCECGDWEKVLVADKFNADRLRNVTFSGENRLGTFDSFFTDASGFKDKTGIRNAHIHNCDIGSNVYIRNIGGYLANYKVGDEASIINCGRIFIEGETSFGNGMRVAVIDETGGRSVPVWDRLSAHEAYIISLYRHRKKLVKVLETFNSQYTRSVTSNKGTIGSKSQLKDCVIIKNVKTGPGAVIEGALRLINGSVNSSMDASVYIGSGVIMEHFIVCSGSVVDGSAIIDKCFIGQGCVLKNHFTASNSLFFANCEGYLGETCSVFAGPYTVSHHKSTLLIAGMFSFMNAGSGSNQSNHMYKLGPVHQGIVERGSKTASDSYLLWPALIGPYTFIKGRHYKNLDTSSFPFSFLIEDHQGSVLIPAINLASVGTIRDGIKWPLRDRRKDPVIIDKINFDLLNPAIVGKMLDGREILKTLKAQRGDDIPYYMYHNMRIKASMLTNGIRLYQIGINKYLGGALIKRLDNTEFNSIREIRERLAPASGTGIGRWVDIAGLTAPREVVEGFLNDIESGKVSSIEQIENTFNNMSLSIDEWEWNWVHNRLEEEEGKHIASFTSGDIIGIVNNWKESVTSLDQMLLSDAGKEFSMSSMTGFGIDGGDDIRKIDFEEVRGDYASNNVIAGIEEHIKETAILGDKLITRLERVKQ